MTEEIRPDIPFAGIIYGEIIYWGTIIGSVISIIGATIAAAFTKNVIEPAYLFSQIWEGNSPATIWEGAVGAAPKGHWYLDNLLTGDGLAMAGLAFGVFAVTPGLFMSGFALLKKRDFVFGGLAVIAALISLVACLGLIALP